MNTNQNNSPRQNHPALSIIMPAYNEEENVGFTIRRLANAFAKAGHNLELVAVDNGSQDRTGEIIQDLVAQIPTVVYHRVIVNEGYGNGVLSAIPRCTAPWIGIIPADGQVDAEDVVRLFEAVIATNGKVLGKVRRRFRMDGLPRKIISTAYNVFVRVLWPTLGTLDVNGSPKILPRNALLAMRLTSKQWFLDPEIIIKSHYMGIRILEFNVFARMRGNGISHVRVNTCWEFLRSLLRFRFTPVLSEWQRELNSAPPVFEPPVISADQTKSQVG
ncbi:MAG: glycosyltransferase family 2 protein [Chloroflexi bacterium]|nr:glycosyltransferase family 2 protein [Chloroflexota bacterium]